MKILTLQDKERDLLRKVLKKTGWDLEKAARLMRIPVSQVKKKIGIHGLQRPENSIEHQ